MFLTTHVPFTDFSLASALRSKLKEHGDSESTVRRQYTNEVCFLQQQESIE